LGVAPEVAPPPPCLLRSPSRRHQPAQRTGYILYRELEWAHRCCRELRALYRSSQGFSRGILSKFSL